MERPGAHPITTTAPDRRRHPRYSVQIEIHPDGTEVPMRLETTDLSRGGCYVQLMMTLSVGVRLRATLWLDGTPIVVRGLVVTRHPQFGNGIMFVDFEGEGATLLDRYLNAVTALTPSPGRMLKKLRPGPSWEGPRSRFCGPPPAKKKGPLAQPRQKNNSQSS
jgi:hypothetical protein